MHGQQNVKYEAIFHKHRSLFKYRKKMYIWRSVHIHKSKWHNNSEG